MSRLLKSQRLPEAAPLTWDMVFAHTRQLAVNAGRGPHEITQGDYEEAKRELTGATDMDQQMAILKRGYS
jgi:hypothetical protein